MPSEFDPGVFGTSRECLRERVIMGTSIGGIGGGLEDESEAARCLCISGLTTGCLPSKSRPVWRKRNK